MVFSGFISKIFDKVSGCGEKNHSPLSQPDAVSQELQLMIRLQYQKVIAGMKTRLPPVKDMNWMEV